MTSEELTRLKALCEAASPAPWVTRSTTVDIGFTQVIYNKLMSVDGPHGVINFRGVKEAEADAEFIAAARTAMPLLIAEVERLEGITVALDEVRSYVRVLHDGREELLVEIARLQENERSDLLNSKIRRQEIERLRAALQEIANKHRSCDCMDAPALAREALK